MGLQVILLPHLWTCCRGLAADEELSSVLISVDTFSSQVAREAVAAGADMVNDISGGSLDPGMRAEVG